MSLEHDPARSDPASHMKGRPPAQGPPAEKLAYSIPEAVRATSISRSSLYEAIADGRLIARKIGSRTIIATDELRKFIASLPAINSSTV